jgi:hypothetical protein
LYEPYIENIYNLRISQNGVELHWTFKILSYSCWIALCIDKLEEAISDPEPAPEDFDSTGEDRTSNYSGEGMQLHENEEDEDW